MLSSLSVHFMLRHFIIGCVIMLLVIAPAQAKTALSLTAEEQEWLAAHPVLSAHNEQNWPPFNFYAQGMPQGFSIDYLNLLAQKIGITIAYRSGATWNEYLAQIEARELDIMLNIVKTEARARYLLFTEPYATTPNVIVSRQAQPVSDLAALNGRVVAIPHGFFYQELLARDYPDIRLLPVATVLEGLTAVATGLADATLGREAVLNDQIQRNLLTTLRISGELRLGDSELTQLRIGVRSDWPLLQSILNQAMAAVTPEELNALRQRWFSTLTATEETHAPLSLWSIVPGALTLIGLTLLLLLGLRQFGAARVAQFFDRHNLRQVGMLAVAGFLALVLVVALYGLRKMEHQLRHELGETLISVNSSTKQTLEMWLSSHEREIRVIARDPALLALTQQLTALPHSAAVLTANALLPLYLRQLQPQLDNMGAIQFCVIAPERTVVAASVTAQVGQRTQIAMWQPELLTRALAGETVFIPPVYDSSASPGAETANEAKRQAAMFMVTPIADAAGRIWGALALQFDPQVEFSPITRVAQVRGSGESYVFNRAAMFLTPSRFAEALEPVAEYFREDTSLLGLRVRDPGGNLLKGFEPPMLRAQWPLTRLASAALSGLAGHDIDGYRDYRGVMVIGAWSWSERLGVGLATELDVADALAPYRTMRTLVLGSLLSVAVLALGLTALAIWLGERTRDRLQELVAVRTHELRKLAQAVEQNPLCIVITDVKGCIEHVNPMFTAVTGYTLAEVYGKNPRVLKSGLTPPEQYGALWATICSGQVWHSEICNRRKNGELYWGAISIAPVTDASGQVTHFVSMTKDLTEAKQVELALREAEATRQLAQAAAQAALERNALILDCAGEGIIGLDTAGIISFCNRAAAAMLDHAVPELVGEVLAEVVGDAVGSCQLSVVSEDGAARPASTATLNFRRRDGSQFPVEVVAVPLRQAEQLLGTVIVFKDITERQLAAQALAAREQHFRTLVDTIPGTVYRCAFDAQWTMLFISDEVERLTGYPANEFTNNAVRTFASVIHPDDVQLVADRINAAVAAHLAYTVEYRVIDRAGRVHFVYEQGQATYADTHDTITLAGTVIDITERKQIETTLAEERAQLKTLLDTTPLGVAISTQGIIRFANPKFLNMLDFQVGDLVSAMYVDPHEREIIIERLVQSGRVDNYEVQFYGRDRQVRDMLADFMVLNYQGEPGVLGWVLDITDRKQAEERIRASEARLEAAASAANLGLWDYFPNSGEVFAHLNFATQRGYAPDTLRDTAEKWSRVRGGREALCAQIHPDDQPLMRSHLQAHLDGDTDAYRAEYRVYCADGSWKWLLDAGQVIARDERGAARRMVGVCADIDTLKQLQAELEHTLVLAEEATRAKSDFLANMSHEIRTPMNAIIGMSHLALQTELDAKQHNYIDKVHRSAEALLGIINDILDFSKIEAGKLDMEVIDFRLEDVMDNLANLVGLKAEEKGVELMFDIHADVPTALIGDPLRLGQILINLGNNAVKFTERGGDIVVTVTATELSERSVQLQFMVRDSGIGMTAEQQTRLFQSFSQADMSTTRKYGGTGLGLAICKRLTDMMGGTIWADSAPDCGSTFAFTAHFQRQQGALSAPRFKTMDIQTLRVLIVDDNATSREILSEMLAQFGFAVDQAGTGQTAIALLEQADDANPYDLVLMDWKMPDMDGVATIRAIQNDASITHVPTLIMVTAYGREEVQQAAAGLDLAGFLTKPVTPSTLLDTIMQAIGHEIASITRAASRQEEASDAVARLRGMRVLLVEDNEINQELALELLTSNGLCVEVANHGLEALHMLDNASYDGVLMDCQMPVMDGYEATRQIRAQARFAQLPVIAMTANVMTGDRDKVLEVGMNDHIGKPINVRELFTVLAKWLAPLPETALQLDETCVTDNRQLPTDNAPTDAFPALPGIDTAVGLAITQHNPALYRKLLLKFRASQHDFAAQFAAAHTSADPEAATRCAHTLKGVAGNIGATATADAARELEAACLAAAEPAVISELLAATVAALTPVIDGLAVLEAAATTVAPTAQEIDHASVVPLLTQLRDLLADDDTDAATVVEQLQPLLAGTAWAAVLEQIRHAVDDYDFETALTALSELLRQLTTDNT